jgi:hypothetical protein
MDACGADYSLELKSACTTHEHFALPPRAPAFFSISMTHKKFAFPYEDLAAVVGFFV